MIIPSIDLMNGKAVQLRHGAEKVLEREDVLTIAETFSRIGELAVIDLDAALGHGDNRELIKTLCRRFPCRVGGGIRSAEEARAFLRAGARRVILGTAARPEVLSALRPETVIVAVDEKNDEVVDCGWTHGTGESVIGRIKELEAYCSGFLYTLVDREGMMQGTSLDRIRAVRAATSNSVTAAGGITAVEEVVALAGLGCEAQLGMAIYTGALELAELFVAITDFGRSSGLCPTVVENEDGETLMLAYSSPESLRLALRDGSGVYYSRSRKTLWRKGESSGNTQHLLRARLDCDRDAIRFTVRQAGPACHTGAPTCFGAMRPALSRLETILTDRKDHPVDSFASRLMQDEQLIMRKLHEEVWEVSHAGSVGETTHEAADLLFFATALLVKRGLSWTDVLYELRGREK
ncbi:MAG: phosphoribosyl-ATP diphosphatase [Candidatus Schekmanbacteria bacterium]|nr:phosphoribosyl-ATP diphosphatase [Candidatus Schekmanbacteria bacterium]